MEPEHAVQETDGITIPEVFKKHVDMAPKDTSTTWTNYTQLLVNMMVVILKVFFQLQHSMVLWGTAVHVG